MSSITWYLRQMAILFGILFLLLYLLILPPLMGLMPEDIELSGPNWASIFLAAIISFPFAIFIKTDLVKWLYFYRFALTYLLALVLFTVLHAQERFNMLFGNATLLTQLTCAANLVMLLIVSIIHIPALGKRAALVSVFILLLIASLAWLNFHLAVHKHSLGSLVLLFALIESLVWELSSYTKSRDPKLFWLLLGCVAILHLVAIIYLYGRYTERRARIAAMEQMDESKEEEPEAIHVSTDSERYPWLGPRQPADSTKAYFIEYLLKELKYDYFDTEHDSMAVLSPELDLRAFRLESPAYLYNPRATADDISPAFTYLNDAALYIARDSNRLLCCYHEFSDELYGLLRPTAYSVSFDPLVKMLLRSFNMVEAVNFRRIANTMVVELDSITKDLPDYERVNALVAFLAQNGYAMPREDVESEKKVQVFWAYTFWTRRFRENNLDAVHSILLNIDQHYTPNNSPRI